METGSERLFRVLGDVGGDLIATAERKAFARSRWQKWLPVAACLVLLVGMGYFALPHLTAETESCPAEQPETAAPQVPAQTPETESDRTEATPSENKTTGGSEGFGEAKPIQSGAQLVFWDTIYYVEAVYEAEQAVALTDGWLGQVEAADDETLVGAEVFLRRDAATRPDSKEREVPLEIFVYSGGKYLYCLTYYDTDEPLLEWLAVQTRWYYGRLDELVETFVTPLEPYLSGRNWNEADGDDLLTVFLATLELERAVGRRTADLDKYQWYDGEVYVIPEADLQRQLDKYLDSYIWKPETMAQYDTQRQAVVLQTLTVEGASNHALRIVPERCTLDEEQRKLTLVVQRYRGQALLDEWVCRIRFDADRCVYEFVAPTIAKTE